MSPHFPRGKPRRGTGNTLRPLPRPAARVYTLQSMTMLDPANARRYARQTAFEGLGADGQRRLLAARVLLVGVGGLGSWTAELLARAGLGRLRIADADVVELANLHRQALYDESDAQRRRPKVHAAADRLRCINADLAVEPVAERVEAGNIARLAEGVDVILDGTDNFAARLLINDYCVRAGVPWVFAGVVGAEGQVMTILPGRTACLRCLHEGRPTDAEELAPQAMGVLGPAVATVAAFQAAEAMKLLAGRLDAVSPWLTKVDLWRNTVRSIAIGPDTRDPSCVCCGRRRFEHLEP